MTNNDDKYLRNTARFTIVFLLIVTVGMIIVVISTWNVVVWQATSAYVAIGVIAAFLLTWQVRRFRKQL